MEYTGLLERLTKVEERVKSNTCRLEELSRVTDEIHTMSETMIQLVSDVRYTKETVRNLSEKVDQMDDRVDIVERGPADDLKSYKQTAVTAIITTIATALAVGMIVLVAQFI